MYVCDLLLSGQGQMDNHGVISIFECLLASRVSRDLWLLSTLLIPPDSKCSAHGLHFPQVLISIELYHFCHVLSRPLLLVLFCHPSPFPHSPITTWLCSVYCFYLSLKANGNLPLNHTLEPPCPQSSVVVCNVIA